MINFSNVSVNYGAKQALCEVNVNIKAGSMLALIGPNGGGKSTWLKCLLGIIKPSSGSVSLNIDKQKIAYLPQFNTMDKSFPISVKEVVSMGFWKQNRLLSGLSKQQKNQLDDLLDKLNLTKLQDMPIGSLSGGELQKTLFARIMLQDADLILLDEPFVAIDAPATKELSELIGTWHAEGKTIIVVAHDLQQVRTYFPESLMISKTNIAHGKTSEVITDENLAKALQNSLVTRNTCAQIQR